MSSHLQTHSSFQTLIGDSVNLREHDLVYEGPHDIDKTIYDEPNSDSVNDHSPENEIPQPRTYRNTELSTTPIQTPQRHQ